MKKLRILKIAGISTAGLVMVGTAYNFVIQGYRLDQSFFNAISPYYWSLKWKDAACEFNKIFKSGSTDPYQTRFTSDKEFENWLNKNDTWTRSAKIQFFNLGQCESVFNEYSGTYTYNCSEGFARISSPMGESICPISSVSYTVNIDRSQSWNQSSDNCMTPKQIAESRDTSYLSSIGLLALGGAIGYAGSILARNAVKRNKE